MTFLCIVYDKFYILSNAIIIVHKHKGGAKMFNTGFPPIASTPMGVGDMIWVNNKNELQAVTVQPNKQKVFFLRDADNPIFYVVSANEIGMTSISAYSFSEVKEARPEDKFVTREEFKKLLDALGGEKNNEQPII